MPRRPLLVSSVLAVLAGALMLASTASAAPAFFSKISADGSTVVFATTDRLVPSDTDTRTDVYVRTGTTTSLVSANLPVAGNGPFNAFFSGASADASHIFFATSEPVVAADTDTSTDVYERFAGTTTLVSVGPSGGSGPFPADLRSVSSDGLRAIFTTDEPLTPDDTDSNADIYERSGGVTTLLSTGATGGNSPIDVQFRAASADSSRVFFVTSESLVAADTDGAVDVYEHSGGATSLDSVGLTGGNGAVNVSFGGASADGSVVFFETNESLFPTDTDAQQDVYRRSAGVTTLVSTGLSGGNGPFDASLAGNSPDGSHAYLLTAEPLVSSDTDGVADLYDHAGATTTQVSVGPAGGNAPFIPRFLDASADGSRVFFATNESLVSTDTDTAADVYQRSGGATTLVSVGSSGQNGTADISFNRASADGSAVLFTTADQFAPSDTDSSRDVYQRSGAATTLVSTNVPFAGNGPYDAGFLGATADLSHIVFETREHLTSDDTDASTDSDLFDRSGGATKLISGGGVVSTSPDAPGLTATNPGSPSGDNNPRVIGTAPATFTVGIYSTPDCSGPPLATGTGAAFASSGIQVSVPSDTTTVFRATATDEANNTSPCSSDFLIYQEVSTVPGPDPVAAPTLSATSPGSPGADPQPRVIGSAPSGTTVKLYLGAGCSGGVAATGTSTALGSTGIQLTVPRNASTTITATATDAVGTVSPCSNPIVYVEAEGPGDATAPRAPALDATTPRSPANANTFAVHGAAAADSLIRLYRNGACDGAPVGAGTAAQLAAGGLLVTVADDSVTEIHATATDAAGNVSRCSTDSVTYVEDSTAPRTRITFGPAFKTRDTTPTFRFADLTGDPSTTFLCKLDRKPFHACSSPRTFRGMSRRRHTLWVKAVDAAGNSEASARKRRFRIVGRR